MLDWYLGDLSVGLERCLRVLPFPAWQDLRLMSEMASMARLRRSALADTERCGRARMGSSTVGDEIVAYSRMLRM